MSLYCRAPQLLKERETCAHAKHVLKRDCPDFESPCVVVPFGIVLQEPLEIAGTCLRQPARGRRLKFADQLPTDIDKAAPPRRTEPLLTATTQNIYLYSGQIEFERSKPLNRINSKKNAVVSACL